MNKKSAIATLISALLLSSSIFSAVPANASDDDDKEQKTGITQVHDQDHDDDLEKKVREEIKRKYGQREHLQMPPLVVRLKKSENRPEKYPSQSESESESDSDSVSSTETDATFGGASMGQDGDVVVSGGGVGTSENSGSYDSNSTFGSASLSNLVVTVPQTANTSETIAVLPKSAQNISVLVGEPIEISSIRYTIKTPAERFIEAASFGLFAMLISALGLAAVVGSRAIRRK